MSSRPLRTIDGDLESFNSICTFRGPFSPNDSPHAHGWKDRKKKIIGKQTEQMNQKMGAKPIFTFDMYRGITQEKNIKE